MGWPAGGFAADIGQVKIKFDGPLAALEHRNLEIANRESGSIAKALAGNTASIDAINRNGGVLVAAC
jgi:hypothetical protein